MTADRAAPTKPRKWGWFLLFTSSTALVCCALPIMLVALGFGAAVASLYGGVPALAFLGIHKDWVFGITALLLGLATWALYRPGRVCPSDPDLAGVCQAADRWNGRLLWIAAAIWLFGFFMAFLLLPLWKAVGLL